MVTKVKVKMMRTIKSGIVSLLTVVYLLLGSSLQAVSISISLPGAAQEEVNGKMAFVVSVGKSFEIQVRVSDGNRDTGSVELEGAENLAIRSTGQSTSVTMVNGAFSSNKTYTYHAIAQKAGAYLLGPARLKQNNKTISSSAIAFIATEKEIKQTGKKRVQNSGNEADEETEVTAKLLIDNKRLVVGQAVEVTAKILMKGSIVDMGLQPLTLQGFSVEEAGKGKQYRKIINGVPHIIYEKKYVLTPSNEGVYTVGPLGVEYTYRENKRRKRRSSRLFGHEMFEDFFNMHRVAKRTVHSDQLTLTVGKLPEHSSRVDGVGNFSKFSASVNQHRAQVGQPITLTLTLEGKGNLEQIPDPELTLPSSVRSYKSKTHIRRSAGTDATAGKKVYEFVLQAKEAGPLIIPPQEFTFYCPGQGYKTMRSNELTIDVQPSSDDPGDILPTQPRKKEKVDGEKQEASIPEIKREEVHFIEEAGSASKKQAPALPFWLFLLLVFIPCGGVVGWLTRRFNLNDFAWNKKREHSRLTRQLTKEFEIISSNDDASHLYQFYMRFLALKLNTSINEVNEEFVAKKLLSSGFPVDKVDEFLDHLNECASLSFTAHAYGKHKHQELLKRAQYWFLLINK